MTYGRTDGCPAFGATSAACCATCRAGCWAKQPLPESMRIQPAVTAEKAAGAAELRGNVVPRELPLMVQPSDQQIAAHPALSPADSTAVTRDQARAVLGHVMGLVALTLGFLALGAPRAVLGPSGTARLRPRRDLRLDPRRERDLVGRGTRDLRRLHDPRLQPAAALGPGERGADRGEHLPGRPKIFLFFLQLFGGKND
jgi:hypothetical protein